MSPPGAGARKSGCSRTQRAARVGRDGYLRHVELTEKERELRPTALLYMMLEWGVWTVINGEWHLDRHARFLTDLLAADLGRYAL
ncbi:hypothetical protein [Nonomuraea dietziae]|uniref:hypothetical protein n=1 Tax=Nonomuraea dietziae TaxID=65515 RepID=UPI003400CB6A